MTLFEALKRISRDSYAETKTPRELAALIKPWLINPCSDPVMQRLSGVHFMLRAAESLTDIEDLEPRLFLISLARKICRTILNHSPLPRRPASQETDDERNYDTVRPQGLPPAKPFPKSTTTPPRPASLPRTRF
jgi:hypothetical protein